MEVTAKLKNVSVSARKMRLVADVVRNKSVQYAVDQLSILNKKSAPLILKLIKSAINNAFQTKKIDVDTLYVKTIYVDGGPMLKRFLPRAQGRATVVRKRTSHVNVTLAEK